MRQNQMFVGNTLLLALVLSGASSGAARTVADRPEIAGPGQEAQERLMERLLDHATAELNLSVEQRDQLERVLRETVERRGELAGRQRELGREIQRALTDPSTDDDGFRRLVDESLALRREGVELLDWQQQRLAEFLTWRQALRFMLMQDRLAQRIEEMRRDRKR